MEESTPVDSEVRREAEIVRQVRESEGGRSESLAPANSSPNLTPTIPESTEGDPGEEDGMRIDIPTTETDNLFVNLVRDASIHSNAKGFWENIDSGTRASPTHRGSTSAIGEDGIAESLSLITSGSNSSAIPATQSIEISQRDAYMGVPQLPLLPTPAEMAKKVGKRRRDDDFDVTSFKRRAVSPGMSVQNSPILAQSPSQRDGGWWSQPKASREGSSEGKAPGERSNSASSMTSSAPAVGPKRVGMQGMTDTHDGLMKMSIE